MFNFQRSMFNVSGCKISVFFASPQSHSYVILYTTNMVYRRKTSKINYWKHPLPPILPECGLISIIRFYLNNNPLIRLQTECAVVAHLANEV